MKKRLLSMLLVLTITMVLFAGCGSSSDSTTSEDDVLKVGVAFSWVGMNAFMTRISTDIQTYVEEDPNMELTFFDAKMDPVVQASQFDELINKDVDVILSCAVDGSTLIPSVKKAQEAGIKVIMFLSIVPEEGLEYLDMYTAYLEDGENGIGRIGARMLAEAVGDEGQVVEIYGNPSTQVALDRSAAFQDEIAKFSDIELVDSQNGEWIKASAQNVTENMINKYPGLKGIYTASDEMAEGAVEAIKNAGLSEQIVVASSSISPTGYDLVKSGDLYCTDIQSPMELAAKVYELTQMIQNGEEGYEKDQRIVAPQLTQDNIDEVERPVW